MQERCPCIRHKDSWELASLPPSAPMGGKAWLVKRIISSGIHPLAYTLPIPRAAPVTMMVFFSSMGLALFCRPPRGKSFLEPPSVHMGAAVHGAASAR